MRLWRAAYRSAAGAISPLGSLIFPTTCWATDVPITPADGGLAPTTREAIARQILWPYCLRCGCTVGLYTDRESPCVRCDDRDLGVRMVVRVGTYDPPLADLVRRMKFERHWELARILAPFLVQAITMQAGDGATGTPVDVLVPVALHWRRRWARGFNQSEELAREAARLTGWTCVNALRRVRATKAQSTALSATERRRNVADAFVAVPDDRLAGKHVWLIDDVATTGATLHAAATALRKLPKGRRPKAIYGAVVCMTDRVPVPEGA